MIPSKLGPFGGGTGGTGGCILDVNNLQLSESGYYSLNERSSQSSSTASASSITTASSFLRRASSSINPSSTYAPLNRKSPATEKIKAPPSYFRRESLPSKPSTNSYSSFNKSPSTTRSRNFLRRKLSSKRPSNSSIESASSPSFCGISIISTSSVNSVTPSESGPSPIASSVFKEERGSLTSPESIPLEELHEDQQLNFQNRTEPKRGSFLNLSLLSLYGRYRRTKTMGSAPSCCDIPILGEEVSELESKEQDKEKDKDKKSCFNLNNFFHQRYFTLRRLTKAKNAKNHNGNLEILKDEVEDLEDQAGKRKGLKGLFQKKSRVIMNAGRLANIKKVKDKGEEEEEEEVEDEKDKEEDGDPIKSQKKFKQRAIKLVNVMKLTNGKVTPVPVKENEDEIEVVVTKNLQLFVKKWEDNERITLDNEEEAEVATKIIEEVSGNKLAFKLRKGDYVINSFDVDGTVAVPPDPPRLHPEMNNMSRFSVRRRSSDTNISPPARRRISLQLPERRADASEGSDNLMPLPAHQRVGRTTSTMSRRRVSVASAGSVSNWSRRSSLESNASSWSLDSLPHSPIGLREEKVWKHLSDSSIVSPHGLAPLASHDLDTPSMASPEQLPLPGLGAPVAPSSLVLPSGPASLGVPGGPSSLGVPAGPSSLSVPSGPSSLSVPSGPSSLGLPSGPMSLDVQDGRDLIMFKMRPQSGATWSRRSSVAPEQAALSPRDGPPEMPVIVVTVPHEEDAKVWNDIVGDKKGWQKGYEHFKFRLKGDNPGCSVDYEEARLSKQIAKRRARTEKKLKRRQQLKEEGVELPAKNLNPAEKAAARALKVRSKLKRKRRKARMRRNSAKETLMEKN